MKRSKRTERTLRSVAKQSLGSQSLAGLGVDIVEIERMERAITRTPRIMQRVFSENERTYAKSKSRPSVHFALFFAAKEAVLKALGTGFSGMNFTDVEVDHDNRGRPLVVLHGYAEEYARAQGIIDIQLSLSYTHQVGVASAVAIKEEHRPRREKRYDPHEELARQFKEARAMLDDMDARLSQMDVSSMHEIEEADAPEQHVSGSLPESEELPQDAPESNEQETQE